MGIQSTHKITRQEAIARITEIQGYIKAKDYLAIKNASLESDADLETFVNSATLENVERWGNRMLERLLDKPFFRRSTFENYVVVNRVD